MSLPTVTLSADLNGTGTLVDISAYVDDLQPATNVWGRTDWSSPSPNPGTLTFTLRNIDGRFTPGNTGTYTVGVRDGVAVQWKVVSGATTRYRWFKMGTPQMQWDNGNANSAAVTITCSDLLGDAQRYVLRTMLDEEVLIQAPSAYWRLDESGTDLTATFADSSGNGQSDMIPNGTAADFSFAQNSGPAKDAGGSVGILESASSLPTTKNTDYIATASDLGIQIPTGQYGTLQLWFSYPVLPPSTTTSDLMPIAQLDMGGEAFTLLIDATGSLRCGTSTLMQAGLAVLSRNRTHHIVMAFQDVPGSGTCGVDFWVDGVNVSGGLSTFTYASSIRRLKAIRLGYVDTSILATLGSTAYYGFVGAVGRVSFHVGATEPTNLAATYQVGQTGKSETPSARASRLGSYLPCTVTPQGTDRGDTLGVQETTGQTLLDAMCDALRTEDAALIAAGNITSQWVEPWLYSTQRPDTSSLTIDLDADHDGTPLFSFDTSAVANTVTVTTPTTSAVWHVPSPGLFTDHPTTVTAAVTTRISARNIAQYRSILGRITRTEPSTVTVDLAYAVNSLGAALYALSPGRRITLSNCPSGILGYSTIDMFVVGATETHTNEGAKIALALQPADGISPAFVLQDTTTGRLEATADNYLTSAITNVATSVPVHNDSVTHFNTTDVPYTIQVDAEQMTVTAVSTAAGTDTLTVTRHANGTSAAAHSAGALVTIAGTGLLIF